MNQALIFYHFGSVDELLTTACLAATRERVAEYSERFAAVAGLAGLLTLGRELYEHERRLGNVTVLTQMLAGAQADPRLRPATAAALQLWIDEIELVLRRVLAGSPLAAVLDPAGLARAVSAGFVGVQLYGGVDEPGGDQALAALERLSVLVEVVEELGPAASKILREKLVRANRDRNGTGS